MTFSAVRADLGDPLALSRPGLLRECAFIDGQWVGAPDDARFAVSDPASGLTIAQVTDGDAAMAQAAVDAAAAAFPLWRAKPAAVRGRLLRRWFDLVTANADDLARIMAREQGKPIAEALAEVAYGASYIEWFAEEARRTCGDVIPAPSSDRELLVIKEPVGVVAVITPWNFPIAMIARKLAPALAAGCTVVGKPAHETPLTALALVALAQEACIPAGVINLVPSANAAIVSAPWMADSRVRKISFTGSTAIGKLLARQGADTVKRLSLELGGNAPLIIFDDADLDLALAGLLNAKFRNGGQACIAANRIYIQDGIYDAFRERIVAAVRDLRVGAAVDGPADIGPLIHDRAVLAMEDMVADAVAHGAELLCGGKRIDRPGSFFAPTVLSNVDATMRLSCEEIFGPILALTRFSSENTVIALANDTPFGLAAYIFTRDNRRIWRVLHSLEAGVVGVNEGAISNAAAPFGGVKESGYGREGSRHGMADYQSIKYVCLGGLGSDHEKETA